MMPLANFDRKLNFSMITQFFFFWKESLFSRKIFFFLLGKYYYFFFWSQGQIWFMTPRLCFIYSWFYRIFTPTILRYLGSSYALSVQAYHFKACNSIIFRVIGPNSNKKAYSNDNKSIVYEKSYNINNKFMKSKIYLMYIEASFHEVHKHEYELKFLSTLLLPSLIFNKKCK